MWDRGGDVPTYSTVRTMETYFRSEGWIMPDGELVWFRDDVQLVKILSAEDFYFYF